MVSDHTAATTAQFGDVFFWISACEKTEILHCGVFQSMELASVPSPLCTSSSCAALFVPYSGWGIQE